MRYLQNIRYQNCCACKKALRYTSANNIRKIGALSIERIRSFFKNPSIQLNNFICSKCIAQSGERRIRNKQDKNLTLRNNEHTILNQINDQNNLSSSIVSTDNSDDSSESNFSQNQIKNKKISKKIELNAASYSKGYCLMCKKKRGLHAIKPESILFAYQNYGLFISKDSRCCASHLETNGDIKYDEYEKIKKAVQLYDKTPVDIIDICITKIEKLESHINDSCGIFDKFKDVASLEENMCKQITGWYKKHFVRFCDLIINVRDSAGRTKEQLVAIYRYWLMKGIDQSTLSLLKCNSSQPQMSHYLAQIRSAMEKDIVPQLLGANKGKEFFLKHNTESVRILHDFTNEKLAIIADGTYTRLEKSSNNEFQYVSYSMQKLDHLLKPFILCCADGYFIDCYGPFRATFNDADILKYIMATDEDLKELVQPAENIFFFLDRGN
jgi:hypothetical protein